MTRRTQLENLERIADALGIRMTGTDYHNAVIVLDDGERKVLVHRRSASSHADAVADTLIEMIRCRVS